MKIWIDTDIGGDIDDSLALLLAMSVKDLEIVGVSTVFENTYLRAEIAKKLLTLGGKPNVPVYAGVGKPLNNEERSIANFLVVYLRFFVENCNRPLSFFLL